MKAVHGSGLVAAVMLAVSQIAAASDVAADSYYQLDVTLETQSIETVHLSDLQGTPVIVAMFYGSCGHVCPMIISTIGMIEARLSPEARDRLRVLMITLDPDRDTPAALTELAQRHRVDEDRWQFARSAPEDVRLIAAMLDVKYRQLPDGGFNHSSPILLLDAAGREITRSEKLGVPDPLFVNQVATALVAE